MIDLASSRLDTALACLASLRQRAGSAACPEAEPPRELDACVEALQAAVEALDHERQALRAERAELELEQQHACAQSEAENIDHQVATTLAEHESRYRTLVNRIPALIYMATADAAGSTLYASPQFETLLGYPVGEWLADSEFFGKLIHPDDRERVLAAWQRSTTTGEPFRCEYRMIARDGRAVWFHDDAVVVRDKAGQPRYLQGIAFDITERKRAEESLREADQRAIAMYDRLLERLADLAQTVGTAQDLAGVYRALLHFIQASAPCSGFFVSHYDPERQERRAVYAWSDGAEEDVSALQPMPMSSSPHSRAVATGQIIVTDDLEAALRHAPHVNIGAARDPRAPQSSLAAPMSVLGRTIGGFEIQSVEKLAYTQEHVAAIRMAANLAAIATVNVQLIERERQLRMAAEGSEERVRQLNDELERRVQERTAELAQTNAMLRDENAERRRAEEELRRAKDDAEQANRAKSKFLSRMSHELRTPMNAILGFAQLMQMGDLPPFQQEYIDFIVAGGQQLLELIDEVLDIARVDSGRLAFAIEPIPVEEVLWGSLDLVRPLASQRGIALRDPGPAPGGRQVIADRLRLQQALQQLLDNAIKYNRPGGSVAIDAEEAAPGWMRMVVRDTGVGIAPDQLAQIFTPFERANAGELGIAGIGLGLTTAQRLVEGMGGKIGATSVPGEGSAFWVELPLLESPASPGARMGSLLYIEDNDLDVELIKAMLGQWPQIRLLAARSGEAGLRLADEFQFDAILLDIQLPDIPGDEVLRRLQDRMGTYMPPVVAITGTVSSERAALLHEAGIHAFLAKPVDPPQLLAVLDEILSGRAIIFHTIS